MSHSALALLQLMTIKEPETSDLAEQAKEKLGYSPDLGSQRSLGFLLMLQEMGITPYTRESVDVYKEKMVQEYSDEVRPIVPWYILAAVGIFISVLFFGPSILSWLFHPWYFGVTCISLTIVGLILTAIASHKIDRIENSHRYSTTASWQITPLSQYTKPVPEDILAKAVAIHNKFPDVKFRVDELQLHNLTVDPFLIVEDRSNSFYIAVWNEKQFKPE